MLTESQAQELIFAVAYPENKIKCPYCLELIDSAKRISSGDFICRKCRSKNRKNGTSLYRFNEWTNTRWKGKHLKPQVIIKLMQAFLGDIPPKTIMNELELGKNAVYRFRDNMTEAILATYPETEYRAVKERGKCHVFGVQQFGSEVKICALPELSPFRARRIIYEANELGLKTDYGDHYLGFIINKEPFLPFLLNAGHNTQMRDDGKFFKFYEAFQENQCFLNMQLKRMHERMKVIEYIYNYLNNSGKKEPSDVHFLGLLLNKN